MAYVSTGRKNYNWGGGVAACTVTLNSTVAGNLLVVGMSSYASDGSAQDIVVTDNVGGNTWTKSYVNQGTGASNVQASGLAYCVLTTGGNTTITVDPGSFASGYDMSVYVEEFTGPHASPVSGTPAVNASTGTSVTTASTGTMTPADNDVLVVAVMGYAATGATTENQSPGDTGFTLSNEHENGSSAEPGSMVWKIISGAPGTPRAGWTIPSTHFAAGIAAFKPAASDTVALTGTVTSSIVEADIVAGGKTIILTVTGDTLVPASSIQTIGYIANALGGTADTTSFSITLPTTVAGDLLILEFVHRDTTDGTIGGTSITTGGLIWTQKHSQLFGASAFSGKLLWTRATGDHSGQTVTGSSLTNACAAILTQYRNVVAAGDPFTNAATIVGEENISTNETQAQITTLVDGCMVCLTVLNSPDLAIATQACTSPGALTERAERLSTGGTDASIAHASALKATAGATGAFTWTQTDAASGSYAYAIEPLVTTPFADSRADIITGIDSAQSEGGGWDAKVKANIPVGNVVRTSSTVVTVTLQAQGDYNITANETITATVPASALAGAIAIIATPTFVVAFTAGGASIVPILISQYRRRVA